MPTKRQPIAERFWRRVAKGGPDDCWLWTGTVGGSGYGHFPALKGEEALAHRLSMRLAGFDLGRERVLHRCDVRYARNDITYRRCVNPRHLFLGTQKDNAVDCRDKGRNPNIKLSLAQVDVIKRERAAGASTKALAERFGVAESTIYYAVVGRSWGAGKQQTQVARKSGLAPRFHKTWERMPDGARRCTGCGELWDGESTKPPGCCISFIRRESVPAGSWIVERLGGRKNDLWRVCGWGTERQMRAGFRELRGFIRQGAICLVDPSGAVVITYDRGFARPYAFRKAG